MEQLSLKLESICDAGIVGNSLTCCATKLAFCPPVFLNTEVLLSSIKIFLEIPSAGEQLGKSLGIEGLFLCCCKQRMHEKVPLGGQDTLIYIVCF